jgi:hypothetical protein
MVCALAALCLFASPATAQIPSSAPFCDGFEDGSGYQTRWTSVEGSQTVVNSPVHSGSAALAFEGPDIFFTTSMYRKNFEACTGEYSAWCRQENIYGFALLAMVQPDPDEHPTWRPGYTVAVSAIGSVHPGFLVARYTGIGDQGDRVDFGSLTPTFGLGEWVRVFMRIYSGGTIIAGYEWNGTVDSVICVDPNPIQNPGRFYVGTAAPSPTPDFFDDVCYDPLPCSGGPVCFDRGADVNCDGIAGDVFDVVAAIDIAFSGGTVIPCASKP